MTGHELQEKNKKNKGKRAVGCFLMMMRNSKRREDE